MYASIARTEQEFIVHMTDIKGISEIVYTYLDNIPHEQWAFWMLTDEQKSIMTYMHTSSNLVEQEMSRFLRLDFRSSLPFDFFVKLLDLWVRLYRQALDHLEILTKTNQEITGFAVQKLRDQLDTHSLWKFSYDKHSNTLTALREAGTKSIGKFSKARKFFFYSVTGKCMCRFREHMGLSCVHYLWFDTEKGGCKFEDRVFFLTTC